MLVARYAASLFLPLSVCLELLFVGLLLLWTGRRQRLGKLLVTGGALLLLVCSCGPVGTLLLGPLESAHPQLTNPPDAAAVRWVVVLGAGYRPDPALPASARVPSTGLIRLAEGVRVYKTIPGSRLLVLVGGADGEDGRVETVRELAEAFGVAPAALVVDAGPRSTAEEIDAVRRVAGADRFVLVTSASHMPRAVQLCRDRGLDPIPAPTDHAVGANEYGVLHALPTAGNLGRTQLAFSEAIAWVGRILDR